MQHYKDLLNRIGVPGFFTLLSLFCAWFAISFLLTGRPNFAIFFAGLAFQLDVLDGYLARKLNKTSEFGRQLDSLADIVNYSVFAAVMTALYLVPNLLGAFIGFLIVALGALRLAYFNVTGFIEEEGINYYQGLITCTLSFAATLLYFFQELTLISLWSDFDIFCAIVLGILALLQVSRMRVAKLGVFVLWIPVSIFLSIGSLLWL